MRKNLIIIGYDYAMSRRIANILSDTFNMRYFDLYDMFLFNNSPYSLGDVLKLNGIDYVDKEMRSVLKGEFDFSGVVFVVDTKIIDISQDLFEQIKENNIVLFFKRDFKQEMLQREQFSFKSQEEKEYYSLNVEQLRNIEDKISNELADIVLDIDNLTYRQIKDVVLENLKVLIQ